MAVITRRDPDARGYFGAFGGRFVPETLVEPIEELERAYFQVRDDPEFASELSHLLTHYVGRATPCCPAPVSATMRRLPMRTASKACPMALLILCAPVCVRSSRFRKMRGPPYSVERRLASPDRARRAAR